MQDMLELAVRRRASRDLQQGTLIPKIITVTLELQRDSWLARVAWDRDDLEMDHYEDVLYTVYGNEDGAIIVEGPR